MDLKELLKYFLKKIFIIFHKNMQLILLLEIFVLIIFVNLEEDWIIL